ncbi:MAG: GNAT family N-acetyltransferase [Bacteroidota bacterium]|nr:GNAT family N-acetyltransferase [Bacteroidota bacterium]
MTSKEKYLLLEQEDLPVFLQSWWLDIVCGEQWEVFLYESKGNILAAFPFFRYKNYGFLSIIPPLLTPVCGCYINYKYCKNNIERYSLENNSTLAFAKFIDEQKPANFVYTLSPENFFSMGFYWQKFQTSVRYTYRIDNLDANLCFKNFHKSLRKSIRDAEKKLSFSENYNSTEEIYNLLKQTYIRQKTSIPYSFNIFNNIVKEATNRNQGKLFVAKDNNQHINGAIFILWDKNTCYNLIGGIANDSLQNDVMAFLTWNAIKYACTLGVKVFDMEGSMIKGVEHHFRLYNTKRVSYLVINKEYSLLYKCLRKIKNNF